MRKFPDWLAELDTLFDQPCFCQARTLLLAIAGRAAQGWREEKETDVPIV